MSRPKQSLELESPGLNGGFVARRVFAPIFFYFVAAGVATVMLGPLLPILIPHWNIEDAQAGTLFTASFSGQLLGAWFAARNLRLSVVCGAALSAAGCVAMAWAGFGVAHLALFFVGLGLGAGLTAGNIIVGTSRSAGRARLLLLLNVSWSVGAIACPLLVHLCTPIGISLFFLILAGGLATAACLLLIMPRHAISRASEGGEVRRFPLSMVYVIVFAGVLLLYVGIENALGGWLPSYAVRVHALLQSSIVAFWFWVAELVGRMVGTALLAWVSERALYVICLLTLIAAGLALVAGGEMSAGGILVATALCGVAIGPVYPLVVSFMLARTGQHLRVGAMFASASLGGASLPWLTGVVSTHFQSLRVGLVVPVGGAILMLLLTPMVTKLSPKAEV